MSFPAYVDGKPPVVSLEDYDSAEWAQQTAVDATADGYVAVNMSDSAQVVCKFDQDAAKVLDTIFKSAKKQYVTETVVPDLEAKARARADARKKSSQ